MCSLRVFPVSRPWSALLILAALTHKSEQRKTEGKLHWQNMTLPTMDGGLMVIAVGFQQMQKEGFFVFLNEEQERVIFVIFLCSLTSSEKIVGCFNIRVSLCKYVLWGRRAHWTHILTSRPLDPPKQCCWGHRTGQSLCGVWSPHGNQTLLFPYKNNPPNPWKRQKLL